jgi:hypothetical protein
MKFTCSNGSGQLYFVGTDADEMRKDAKLIDPTADAGTEVNSERVIAAMTDGVRHPDFLAAGVRAARAGTKSFYLFG